MAKVLRPNNDLRPIWDSKGNKLPQDTVNPEWTYSPDKHGNLLVVCDCGVHYADVPVELIGDKLPHCDVCHS